MKNSTMLILGAVAIVGVLLYEASKKAITAAGNGIPGGVALAANTSSIGSSSGLLTPILAGTGGVLSGIEAFINPSAYGTDVTHTVAANVTSNINADTNAGLIGTTDTTDYSLNTDPSTMALYG